MSNTNPIGKSTVTIARNPERVKLGGTAQAATGCFQAAKGYEHKDNDKQAIAFCNMAIAELERWKGIVKAKGNIKA